MFFIVLLCVLLCNFVSYFCVCNFVLCDILLPSGVINDDNFTVSEFLADIVDVNAVVRQYFCNTETEDDRVRVYQFMRD